MSTKKINVSPLGERVLIKPRSPADDKKTASGIIIPETVNKEKPEQGIVIAVGEGRKTDEGTIIPLTVKKGDVVLFSKYSPDEVKIDGEEYFIISESNILAIIK